MMKKPFCRRWDDSRPRKNRFFESTPVIIDIFKYRLTCTDEASGKIETATGQLAGGRVK
jgi:hypothetical protein